MEDRTPWGEIYKVRDKAYTRLRYSHRLGNAKYGWLALQILDLRDIEAATGYELYRDNEAYSILRTVWLAKEDVDRLMPLDGFQPITEISPTLNTFHQPVSQAQGDSILAAFDLVLIPPLSAGITRRGKIVYEVAFGGNSLSARYVWQGDVPDGWQALEAATARALEQFKALVG